MPKITKTVAKNATEPFTWDTEIKGFGLRVFENGAKSYVFQYRDPNGRSRRGTLGKASTTFTAEQARAKAKAWRRVVEDGGDPLGEKRAEREALTVSEVLDAYLKSEKFASKAASTQLIDRGRINRHLRPLLGKKVAKTLKEEDGRRAFREIREGNTAARIKTRKRGLARVTGGEGAARMAIRLARSIWTWAIRGGYVSSNPFVGVELGSDGERDLILEDKESYERMFRTLDELQNTKILKPAHADAIRLVALTGARRGEVQNLRWRHVNLQTGLITFPISEHKTGRKTNKPRVIGLPAAARAIIARQPTGNAEDYVFKASKGNGPITLSEAWRTVRVAAKLPEGIGLHGLRHSIATHLAMGGAEAAELMTLLGHRQLHTTTRYINAARDMRIALAERAAAHIMIPEAEPAGVVDPPLQQQGKL
jgi:integrase